MTNRLRCAAFALAAAVPLSLGSTGLANAYDTKDYYGGGSTGGYEEGLGSQGCTPGYWKNHTESWVRYTPYQSLRSVFCPTPAQLGSAGLLDALRFTGGNGVDGASRNLLRAAVAAVLNAAHDDVAYRLTSAEVTSRVDAALATGNRATILALASELDAANNGGCTL